MLVLDVIKFFSPAHNHKRQSENIKKQIGLEILYNQNTLLFLSLALITTREQRLTAASPETKWKQPQGSVNWLSKW